MQPCHCQHSPSSVTWRWIFSIKVIAFSLSWLEASSRTRGKRDARGIFGLRLAGAAGRSTCTRWTHQALDRPWCGSVALAPPAVACVMAGVFSCFGLAWCAWLGGARINMPDAVAVGFEVVGVSMTSHQIDMRGQVAAKFNGWAPGRLQSLQRLLDLMFAGLQRFFELDPLARLLLQF